MICHIFIILLAQLTYQNKTMQFNATEKLYEAIGATVLFIILISFVISTYIFFNYNKSEKRKKIKLEHCEKYVVIEEQDKSLLHGWDFLIKHINKYSQKPLTMSKLLLQTVTINTFAEWKDHFKQLKKRLKTEKVFFIDTERTHQFFHPNNDKSVISLMQIGFCNFDVHYLFRFQKLFEEFEKCSPDIQQSYMKKYLEPLITFIGDDSKLKVNISMSCDADKILTTLNSFRNVANTGNNSDENENDLVFRGILELLEVPEIKVKWKPKFIRKQSLPRTKEVEKDVMHQNCTPSLNDLVFMVCRFASKHKFMHQLECKFSGVHGTFWDMNTLTDTFKLYAVADVAYPFMIVRECLTASHAKQSVMLEDIHKGLSKMTTIERKLSELTNLSVSSLNKSGSTSNSSGCECLSLSTKFESLKNRTLQQLNDLKDAIISNQNVSETDNTIPLKSRIDSFSRHLAIEFDSVRRLMEKPAAAESNSLMLTEDDTDNQTIISTDSSAYNFSIALDTHSEYSCNVTNFEEQSISSRPTSFSTSSYNDSLSEERSSSDSSFSRRSSIATTSNYSYSSKCRIAVTENANWLRSKLRWESMDHAKKPVTVIQPQLQPPLNTIIASNCSCINTGSASDLNEQRRHWTTELTKTQGTSASVHPWLNRTCKSCKDIVTNDENWARSFQRWNTKK